MNRKSSWLNAMAVAAFAVGAAAFAGDECVWTGGGEDYKWSTAANWKDELKPSNGASVTVDLTGITAAIAITNDIADLELKDLTVSSANYTAEFAGKGITITGTASFNTSEAFKNSVSLALASADAKYVITKSKEYQQLTSISGAGPVDVYGSGKLTLSTASSPNHSGGWNLHEGSLVIWQMAYPFGTGKVVVDSGITLNTKRDMANIVNDFTFVNNVTLNPFGEMTFTGDVELKLDSADKYLKLAIGNDSSKCYGKVAFCGDFTVDPERSKGYVKLEAKLPQGTIRFAGNTSMADAHFSGTFNSKFSIDGPMTTTYSSSAAFLTLTGTNELSFGAANAWPANAKLVYGGSDCNVTVDMNGHDQTMYALAATVASADCEVKSSGGDATLTLTGSSDLAATVAENVVLLVDGGVVNIGDGAVANGCYLGVLNGGKIGCAEGVNITAVVLTEDGTAVKPQSYTAENCTFISGAGGIVVTKYVPTAPSGESLTWVGGTAGDNFSTAANWGVDAADFDSGKTAVSITSAGTDRAVVNGEASVYSVGITRDGEFTLGGNSKLWLHDGGLSLADTGIGNAATGTITAPLALIYGQTWNVGSNAKLNLAGPITSAAEDGVEVTGGGEIAISGDNRGMLMPFVFNDMGEVKVSGTTAFAATNRASVFRNTVGGAYAGPVYENTAVNDTPVAFDLAATAKWNPLKTANTTLTQHGGIVLGGNGQLQLDLNDSSTMVIDGGFAITNNAATAWIQVHSYCELWISGKPWQLGGKNATTLDDAGTIHWGAEITGGSELVVNKSSVVMEIDDAWKSLTLLTLGKMQIGVSGRSNAYLDLNGHDQHINQLRVNGFGDENRSYITSSSPATLFATGGSGTYTKKLGARDVRFLDKAAFSFTGKVADTAINFYNVVGQTEGTLSVDKGTIFFAEGSGWQGDNSRVEVSGTGKLSIDSTALESAFGNGHSKLVLSVEDDGMVLIPDGEMVSVRWMELDGKACAAGNYGGSGCTAAGVTIDEKHFGTGSGILHVSNLGSFGMVISIR